jgi:hypothetical protein
MLRSWSAKSSTTAAIGVALVIGALSVGSVSGLAAEPRKQYWATSLTRTVDAGLLRGLYDAVAHGAVGWLDVDPDNLIPRVTAGINLILYHVGGNCYAGDDCDRFPMSEPTGDRWGNTERVIRLDDPAARKVVIDDLLVIVKKGDKLAPEGSIVGIHLDNVHRLGAQELADVFNEFLRAVEAARQKGDISKNRDVGFVAKNHPEAFKEALDRRLLDAVPLYQINENATLDQDGMLDHQSRLAQDIGRQYCIPVFLKTFGSDVAYTMVDRDGKMMNVYVSQEMTKRMAQLPNISGAAWSVDEERYHPIIFVEGSPVAQDRQRVGPC